MSHATNSINITYTDLLILCVTLFTLKPANVNNQITIPPIEY